MLQAIFYARFHPERGPSIIHQYPANSILPSEQNCKPLVNYSDISAYVIPPYELCNQALSIATSNQRVLGFPISLEDAKYERNRFTFNTCVVLNEPTDPRPWTAVVRKIASFFTALEVEDGYLQAEERLPGLRWAGETDYPAPKSGIVYGLLRDVFHQLSTYSDACIRVSAYHLLNLRLTPPRAQPAKVRAWDVPLLIRALPSPELWTWDLVLQHIHPYIDGVNHVQRIAEVADVELKLVKKAVRELVYHKRALILDIFHFGAIYALTEKFRWFVKDLEMQEECCGYVAIDPAVNRFGGETAKLGTIESTPTSESIIQLYSSLTPGLSVHDFLLANQVKLSSIDIRRFVTFGVIKGFLRRIHKYALAVESTPSQPTSTSNSSPTKPKSRPVDEITAREVDRAWKRAALSSGWATPPATERGGVAISGSRAKGTEELETAADERWRAFLDGQHCVDQLCVEARMSERKIIERLRSGRFGEVILFNR